MTEGETRLCCILHERPSPMKASYTLIRPVLPRRYLVQGRPAVVDEVITRVNGSSYIACGDIRRLVQ